MTASAPVEELIVWRRFYAHPGSTAWGQCRVRSWALTWPGSGPHPLITGNRPSARRLSRQGPCTCAPTQPSSRDVSEALGGPPPRLRLSPRAAAHRWRHWRWWRTHGRVQPIRRGDIALAGPPPPLPSWAAEEASHTLNLNTELGYVTLIELASRAGPGFWVPRFRLRRRRIRVILTPPRGRPARLFLAHKQRGDLTWAPKPPPVPVAGRAPVVHQPLGHYAGSWLLRGGAGPMPRGHHPLPPSRR